MVDAVTQRVCFVFVSSAFVVKRGEKTLPPDKHKHYSYQNNVAPEQQPSQALCPGRASPAAQRVFMLRGLRKRRVPLQWAGPTAELD